MSLAGIRSSEGGATLGATACAARMAFHELTSYVRNELIKRIPHAVRSVPLLEPQFIFDCRRAFCSIIPEIKNNLGFTEVDRPSSERIIILGLITQGRRRL
jgi:hypothetical protein